MQYYAFVRVHKGMDPEFWCLLWQGQRPKGLEIIVAYNIGNGRRFFIFEAETEADMNYFNRLSLVADVEIGPAFWRTEGYKLALNRDLEDFQEHIGFAPDSSQMRLRRRAAEMPNPLAALQWARQWKQEMSDKR